VVKLLEASASEREAVVHGARFVPRHDFNLLYPGATSCAWSREQVFAELSQSGLSDLARILRFDQVTYLPSLLSRLDKTSMASAVECRVPFLDNEMIDSSLTVPPRLKVRVGRENKVILKQIAATYLPNDLVYRRKVGFGTPLASWFRNSSGLGGYLELLLESSARASAYFDRTAVSDLVCQHRAGRDDHSEVIWGLLALELWHRQVLERAAPKDDCKHWQAERTNMVPVDLMSSSVPALHSGMTV
jgi:asparagine synthetase B (glutamine-hydrolysing)